MKITRRQMIQQFGSTMVGWAASSAHASPARSHAPWQDSTWEGRTVFRQGTSRRAVVLLHEINGMSPSCVDFGQELVDKGYQVYMPLLFGHFGQDSTFRGFWESCAFGGFRCETSGKDLSSGTKPIRWVQSFVNHLESDPATDKIGVIGMCQSGAFPIATMKENSKVRAVVLSQPALPFNKQSDDGLSDRTMERARKSKVPMLAFRFAADTICAADRFRFLEFFFGSEQFHPVVFDHCDCAQTMKHRCHAVLTGTTEDARKRARVMVKNFFDTRLA
jgi:dienelactone hydrolase